MGRKEDKYFNKSFKYMIAGTAIMLVAALATAFVFGMYIRTINSMENDLAVEYAKHYAFVVDENDREFWDEVYSEAKEQAQRDNIYLEDVKESIDSDCSGAELLRMAINSNVDGIMYAGSADEQVEELINDAVKKGICVVVMHSDVERSNRNCFVGTSNYEIGKVYASQIIEITDINKMSDTNVDILINGDMSEGSANLITLAIEDALLEVVSEDNLPQIEIIRINAEDTFSAEENIRNLFLSEKGIPDIMLCLEGTYTQCVYQAIVDYNHVGEVKVIGYFANEGILEAIDKQIIYSTVSVDTKEMARSAVLAIEEYNEMGYTNSYMPIGMKVIGRSEAKQMLEEPNEDIEGISKKME